MRLKYVLWVVLSTTCLLCYGNDTVKQPNTAASILFTVSAKHLFSNPVVKDDFKLSVTGKSVADGKIKLSIFTSDHKQIFTDSFPAYDLLYDYDAFEFGGGNKLSAKKKKSIILSRMNDFFTESNFRYPAINANEKYDKGDNIDKSVWDDIHSDKTAIGFVYLHGYEGSYGIAFSKKKKITVLYYYSD